MIFWGRMYLVVLVAVSLFSANPAQAEMEWSVLKQLSLKASPIDVSPSPDGQLLYILTQGELLVYSVAEDRITDHFPVEKTYDRLTNSAAPNVIILSSSSDKTIKVVQLDTIGKFDPSDLAFKGPEKAPVTVVVFSDYQ